MICENKNTANYFHHVFTILAALRYFIKLFLLQLLKPLNIVKATILINECLTNVKKYNALLIDDPF